MSKITYIQLQINLHVNFTMQFPICIVHFQYAISIVHFHYAFHHVISTLRFPLCISIDPWSFKLDIKILWTNIKNSSKFYGNFIKQKIFCPHHLIPIGSPMAHIWECNSIGIFHWTSTTLKIDGQIHPWCCPLLMFPLNNLFDASME